MKLVQTASAEIGRKGYKKTPENADFPGFLSF